MFWRKKHVPSRFPLKEHLPNHPTAIQRFNPALGTGSSLPKSSALRKGRCTESCTFEMEWPWRRETSTCVKKTGEVENVYSTSFNKKGSSIKYK